MNTMPIVHGGGAFATDHTRRMGGAAEARFATACTKGYGYGLRPATRRENMVGHFDFVVTVHNGRNVRVEVKAMKSRRRPRLALW
jgi:hypothetical protein